MTKTNENKRTPFMTNIHPELIKVVKSKATSYGCYSNEIIEALVYIAFKTTIIDEDTLLAALEAPEGEIRKPFMTTIRPRVQRLLKEKIEEQECFINDMIEALIRIAFYTDIIGEEKIEKVIEKFRAVDK